MSPPDVAPGADRPRVLAPEELGSAVELARLVDELRRYEPPDDAQARLRTEMLEFAAAHPGALHRSSTAGHFTGSALVLDPERGQVLVLLHTKLRKWLQPGGHTDGEANLARTAWREATEETGIDGLAVVGPLVDLDIHEVRPPREDAHLHLDVRYLVLAPAGAQPVGNHESEALRWVAPGQLEALGADEGLQRLARRGVALASRL